jgi:replicative DNA helicase
VVGLLYRDSKGKDDEDAGRDFEEEALAIKFYIAKQRNGPTGEVNLTFLKPFTRFESAAKISEDDVPISD